MYEISPLNRGRFCIKWRVFSRRQGQKKFPVRGIPIIDTEYIRNDSVSVLGEPVQVRKEHYQSDKTKR